jgi:hypothetical protein
MTNKKFDWYIWQYETLSHYYYLGIASLIEEEDAGFCNTYLVEFCGILYWII